MEERKPIKKNLSYPYDVIDAAVDKHLREACARFAGFQRQVSTPGNAIYRLHGRWKGEVMARKLGERLTEITSSEPPIPHLTKLTPEEFEFQIQRWEMPSLNDEQKQDRLLKTIASEKQRYQETLEEHYAIIDKLLDGLQEDGFLEPELEQGSFMIEQLGTYSEDANAAVSIHRKRGMINPYWYRLMLKMKGLAGFESELDQFTKHYVSSFQESELEAYKVNLGIDPSQGLATKDDIQNLAALLVGDTLPYPLEQSTSPTQRKWEIILTFRDKISLRTEEGIVPLYIRYVGGSDGYDWLLFIGPGTKKAFRFAENFAKHCKELWAAIPYNLKQVSSTELNAAVIVKLPDSKSHLEKWCQVWQKIRIYAEKGWNANDIEKEIQLHMSEYKNLPTSARKLRDIIKAGKAGLLDISNFP